MLLDGYKTVILCLFLLTVIVIILFSDIDAFDERVPVTYPNATSSPLLTALRSICTTTRGYRGSNLDVV